MRVSGYRAWVRVSPADGDGRYLVLPRLCAARYACQGSRRLPHPVLRVRPVPSGRVDVRPILADAGRGFASRHQGGMGNGAAQSVCVEWPADYRAYRQDDRPRQAGQLSRTQGLLGHGRQHPAGRSDDRQQHPQRIGRRSNDHGSCCCDSGRGTEYLAVGEFGRGERARHRIRSGDDIQQPVHPAIDGRGYRRR